MGRLGRTATAEVPPDDAGLVPGIVLPGEECDHRECPSAVAVSITLTDGRVLGFCGHHGRECHDRMILRGIVRSYARVG
jgi:hypothetical protein